MFAPFHEILSPSPVKSRVINARPSHLRYLSLDFPPIFSLALPRAPLSRRSRAFFKSPDDVNASLLRSWDCDFSPVPTQHFHNRDETALISKLMFPQIARIFPRESRRSSR